MESRKLTEQELEKVSGGPEERTVLGQKSAVDCRKCESCGLLIESDSVDICPVCGGKVS